MKKNRVAIIIATIIIGGISAISYFSFYIYSQIIRDDIMNISKLTSTSIYSEIDNELTKPIFVSLTMANDAFVKEWINNEGQRQETEIINYLEGIRSKYDYQSVFLVSDQSNRYYTYDGLLKVVDDSNNHDQWYYQFMKQDNIYALDVDQDEANNQLLTVFINCKIYDENNQVIGVTGVGIEMNYLQNLLLEFEDNYSLEALLVDSNGLIQAHRNGDYIESVNINDLEMYQGIGQALYDKSQELNVFDVNEEAHEEFVISHYIEEMDWYLIVRKNTQILAESLYKQMFYDFMFTVLILISILFIVLKVLKKNNDIIRETALLDSFGVLMNRKGFDEKLKYVLRFQDETKDPWCLFMMDLDGFKRLNDTHGHLQGDAILKQVMILGKSILADHLITRWGGDELSGIIYLKHQEAYALLEKLRIAIGKDLLLAEYNISVSIGLTQATAQDSEDSIIKRADQALYAAKSRGKNQVVYQ
ncbi:sensor domain-containing diguanylate cyclase [Eubacteriaceae bacterium ES3]|nr:sensor domain-containing diguanylate cyclase [Eubacteriaceae bacterium ES3]